MSAYSHEDVRRPLAEDVRKVYGTEPEISVRITHGVGVVDMWVGETYYCFTTLEAARDYFRADRLLLQVPNVAAWCMGECGLNPQTEE